MTVLRIVALALETLAWVLLGWAASYAILVILPGGPPVLGPFGSPLQARTTALMLAVVLGLIGAFSAILGFLLRKSDEGDVLVEQKRLRESRIWGDELLCWCTLWWTWEVRDGREPRIADLANRIAALRPCLSEDYRAAIDQLLTRLRQGPVVGPKRSSSRAPRSFDRGILRVFQVCSAMVAACSFLWAVFNTLGLYVFGVLPIFDIPVSSGSLILVAGLPVAILLASARLAWKLQGELGRMVDLQDSELPSQISGPLATNLARWASEWTEPAFDPALAALLCIAFGILPDAAKRDLLEKFYSAGRLRGSRHLPLAGADLSRVDLRGFRGVGIVLDGVLLDGASLAAANLEESRLEGASLREADLSRCRLRAATLRSTDLSGAQCQLTDFTDVDMGGARTEGANFWGCTGYVEA